MDYKQQILEALKAKFQGVSADILNRIANKLSKTVTSAEQVATAVEGVTIQQVIESYGDSRATESAQTAVRNYEANHNLKDGKPIETPPTPPTGGQGGTGGAPAAGGTETVPAWAQTLIDSNKTLTDRLAKMEGERTTASRKQKLSEVTSKLPEELRKPYERTAIENLSDEDFNSLLGEITTEVETISGSIAAKGAVFGKPAAHGSQTTQNALTKEQEAAISQREGMQKDGQQPF